MHLKFLVCAASLAGGTMAALPARAQSTPVASTKPGQAMMVKADTPQSVVDALVEGGYTAELKKDSDGDPLVVATVEGAKIGFVFGGCKNRIGCNFLSMYFGLSGAKKPTLEQVNDINKRLKFGRAFVDNDGDLGIMHEVTTAPSGMSRAVFLDTVDWFRVASGTVVKSLQ